MKTRSSNYLRLLFALGAALWFVAPRASAQYPLAMSVQVSNGYARLSLFGEIGSGCTILYCARLSQSDNWQILTNLTPLPASPCLVADPSPATATRFYRAFSYYLVTNLVPTNLTWILPSTFVMGSPNGEKERTPDETQHVVTLTKGFYLGKYLVTQGEYQATTGDKPSYYVPANGYSADPSRPVEQVSWVEAHYYCTLLTAQHRSARLIPAGWTYRLPTEAEWEYACRAGTSTAFNFGSAIHGGMANFYDNWEYDASLGSSYVANPTVPNLNRTTTVGSYPPNDWGLYDMHGNVMEWCQDWYGTYPTGAVTDPQGPSDGLQRVVRGGCALARGAFCRSAWRLSYDPSSKYSSVGFRVLLAED